MLPRCLLAPAPPGAPRSVIMQRHSPGRTFFGVDARTQVLMRSAVTCPCTSTMAAVMVVSISSFCGRVPRSLEWTDQGSADEPG